MPRPTAVRFLTTALCAALCQTTPAKAGNDDQARLVGIWQGSLRAGPTTLHLVLKVTQDAEGRLKAGLDSLDQGAKDIPASRVSLTKGEVAVEMSVMGAAYSGRISEDGSQIDGVWSQGGAQLPLLLKRAATVPEIRRPQDPRPPYPYLEEAVSYETPTPGVKLAGTLTRPNGTGPFPAVLLIGGSGPQNRDEAVMGHRPFLVLADHLTRQGLAVLRVDDRGVGESTGDFSKATGEDFTSDAQAGVSFLKTRKDVDGRRIGLIGHSEGSIIAPLVATRSQDVAFVVLLAAPGVRGDRIILRQLELLARAGGAPEAQITAGLALQQKLFAALEGPGDPPEVERRLLEAAGNLPRAQLQVMLTPWYRHFLTYDPGPALRKLKCPVLAVSGEKDLQVPPKENLPAIAAALAEGGNRRVETVELPGLNHLLQTSTSGLPTEYGTIEETMAPKALATVSDWILKRTTAAE